MGTKFIEKQVILELNSGCTAQLNNIKSKRHEAFGWNTHKIINFQISLKNPNFSYFKKLDMSHFNFSEEIVVLDDKFG